MNTIEKFNKEIQNAEYVSLQVKEFLNNSFTLESKIAPIIKGFEQSIQQFDSTYWDINGFILCSGKIEYRRYVKYKETKIKSKLFRIFPISEIEITSDLEEIENIVKPYKYDIKFFPSTYVYLSWITYYIIKDGEYFELDRKGYLEILRRVHRVKINKKRTYYKNKIRNLLNNEK